MNLKNLIHIALILVLPVLLWAKEDEITLVGKDKQEVFIVSEDGTTVEFKDLKTGATQKVKAEQVEMILYKDAHVTFERAMEAIESGDWQSVLQNILQARKAMKESRNNWHENYLGYYTAKALSELARTQENAVVNAEKFLLQFIKQGADSRFYPNSNFDLANLYVHLERYDDARKLLEAFDKSTQVSDYKAQAQADIAKSYLLEGKMADAMNLGTKLLQGGVINASIMEVFAVVLIDKGTEYDKAYKLASALVGKGDKSSKLKVHELKGCAAFHLKNYPEALDDLLRAQMLFGNENTASARLNTYLAATIYVLMKTKPSEYGEWEYNAPYVGVRKKLSVADNKLFQKLVPKI